MKNQGLLFSIFTVLLILINKSYAQAPNIEWQNCLGGTSLEDDTKMKQTSDGGYIIAMVTASTNGDVIGNHDVDGEGPFTSDIWVVKLNSLGNIEWQKCLGGTEEESITSVNITNDGGYIIAGETFSTDGDVIGLHGFTWDAWVIKLSNSGVIQWQKCLGGSEVEELSDLVITNDGGFIISGVTYSNDGDVSGNHGASDIWLVKLTNSGVIQWQKCLGGSDYDFIGTNHSFLLTNEGGYLLTGKTYSNDGNVSGNHGSEDVWIVNLNNLGIINWQKCLGGSQEEGLSQILQTTDGGFIVAGETVSNDGDASGLHGTMPDAWIVKLNNLGVVSWQKCIGGTDSDEATFIHETPDGGYIFAGETSSNNWDISGFQGNSDFLVVKMNSTGNIVWQKCLGGSGTDAGISSFIKDGNDYVLAGSTFSNDGDVSGNHGSVDVWIVKINETGSILWQKCLGGFDDEGAETLLKTNDGGYILSSHPNSNSGDVTGNMGMDSWIVKLKNTQSSNVNNLEKEISILAFPNPTSGNVSISGLKPSEQNKVILYTISGEKMTEFVNAESEMELNLEMYAPGIYFMHCDGEVLRVIKK
jgi:hypothetical protein